MFRAKIVRGYKMMARLHKRIKVILQTENNTDIILQTLSLFNDSVIVSN